MLTSIENSLKILGLKHWTKAVIKRFSTLKVKQFDEIPTKQGFLPSTLDLLFAGGPAKLHEHCHRRHAELGPIYRENLGSIELVFVSDTKLIQTILANEGQFPQHNVPRAWSYYNELHQIKRGLFFQVGQPWAKLRRVFNRIMLADPHRITRFSRDVLKINEEFFSEWRDRDRMKNDKSSIIIDDVKPSLCKWSIESTGFMLFGDRMGCFKSGNTDKDHKASQLVESVATMFRETSRFQLLPVQLAHRLRLKSWQRFESATQNMLQIANDYANVNIAKLKRKSSDSSLTSLHAPHSLTKDLLDCKQLSDEEISQSLVDLIIAAADTTSNSLQWMLYLIAKHSEIQEKLIKDSMNLLKSENLEQDLENISDKAPYLRAFMKEVLRLYPTAPFLARTLDKDIHLGEYKIPKGKTMVLSLFTTSRHENYFDDPLAFKPERWFRSTSDQCPVRSNHAFASLPFGTGLRKCIGYRAAEMQMSLFVASFVKNFESCLLEEDANIGIRLEMILGPDKPIRLKLKSRSSESCWMDQSKSI